MSSIVSHFNSTLLTMGAFSKPRSTDVEILPTDATR